MEMKLYDSKSNQSIDFFIPEKYKNIAVNCSGGADSSILLYTTIKFLQENQRNDSKITVLTCANDRKGRWNAKNAGLVINYVIEKTKTNIIDTHLSYYRDIQHQKYFHEIESNLFRNKQIDLIISGVTANPIDDTLVKNIDNKIINLTDEALLERDGRNQKIWHYYEDASWYTPFANVDKKFVAFLYNLYQVNDLLELTRSCEGFKDSTDNFTKPCGNCWWCLEKKWAFGKF
jgi:7-cyano-7-deazaguanine synthase in queuosine biosynthesis